MTKRDAQARDYAMEASFDLSRRMPHPWCSDFERDRAVRAAEDAAAAWRTPLPDHRDLPSSVHDLRRRVEGLEAVADAWRRQCEADAENREAAPVSRKSVNADGLRTERVTLQITQRADRYLPLSKINWGAMWRTSCGSHPGESVRVVEEATIGSGDVFRDVGCGSTGDEIIRLTAERDAVLRERDAARDEAEKATTLAKGLEEKRAYFKRERDAAWEECERLRARVAELEDAAAPAANAGGEANCPAAPDSSQEPVAWGVKWDGKAEIDGEFLYTQKEFAHEVLANNYGRGTVVHLYAAPVAESATTPQPPRGWLTSEEREAVEKCLRHFIRQEIDFLERNDPGHRWLEVWRQAEVTLSALLARSTLPKVKVPFVEPALARLVYGRDSEWLAALAAAGVEVKVEGVAVDARSEAGGEVEE